MTTITDQRTGSADRHLSNRHRFIERARGEIKRAVREALGKGEIGDVLQGGTVSVPRERIDEPQITRGSGGIRRIVLPGNREYTAGDILPRPPGGAGSGSGGGTGKGTSGGDAEDSFQFTLTPEEFLHFFFENLDLPELVRRGLGEMQRDGFHRAGYAHTGSPNRLALLRTALQAVARRIGLHRPKRSEITFLEEGLINAKSDESRAFFAAHLEELQRRRRAIPFIDEMDLRYRRLEPEFKPVTKAVMFCMMDVSGSMTETMKTNAKFFFMLLYIFLTSKYSTVDIVFLRHTDDAEEVDEKTFFYDRKTGGTKASTVFSLKLKIVQERYSLDEWNIYDSYVGDGDNAASDARKTAELMQVIVPLTQYFAYVEVHDGQPGRAVNTSNLWALFDELRTNGLPIAMRRVQHQSEIHSVFADLFARGQTRDGSKGATS